MNSYHWAWKLLLQISVRQLVASCNIFPSFPAIFRVYHITPEDVLCAALHQHSLMQQAVISMPVQQCEPCLRRH